MKTILFIIYLLTINIIVHSQSYIIQADLINKRYYNEKAQGFVEWGKPDTCSNLITIILQDSLIMIANKEKDVYRLLEFTRQSNGIDTRDGDIWSGIQFIAIDQNNIMVMLAIQLYRSKIFVMTIKYGNIELRYQGKPPHKNNNQQQIV